MNDNDRPDVFDVALTLGAAATVARILKGRFPHMTVDETNELAARIVTAVFKVLKGERV